MKKIRGALTGFQKSNESNRVPYLRFVSRDARAPLQVVRASSDSEVSDTFDRSG